MEHYLSYAKFNLYLAVLHRRGDGYHEVDTVLQSIDLADELTFEPLSEPQLEVSCDDPEIPTGPQNLVWKALTLIAKRAPRDRPSMLGMRVNIRKRIPTEAGLGGGSSNAACALCAANTLWNIGLEDDVLEGLGAELGSDVPFFIRGGTQRCRGRGEKLTVIEPLKESNWVVVKPGWANPTGDIYKALRTILTPVKPDIRIILQSLAKRDLAGIVEHGFNDLERPARAVQPEAVAVTDTMFKCGLTGVRLAGSGSAFVGFCPEDELTDRIRQEGRRQGWRVFLVKPTGRGWIRPR